MIEINEACDLVIFGTKGDLSRRKLLPALYKLEKYKKINNSTRIIGVGRAKWSREDYIKIVKTAIKTFLNEDINYDIFEKLSSRLIFCNVDFDQPSDFMQLKKILIQENNIIIYYCAVPPNTFDAIFKNLAHINLNCFPARIILEKPLGICLETSKKINNQISKYFLESQIFRIDHYLGKESILNLFALRFSNAVFFNNWNNKFIDHVQITVAEEVGIEDRWNYFDQIGQMRDMVQNHLLQILTIIAMDKPKSLSFQDIQYKKVKILRSLNKINFDNIDKNTIRGQYASGIIKGRRVPSYIEEKGANKYSQTETFVAVKVDINNSKWKGVPFYLRTGKRLQQKYSEIVVFFKELPFSLFTNSNFKPLQNKLIIRLEPNESIKINFFNKKPGLEEKYHLENAQMKFDYFNKIILKNSVSAYERLLLEGMRGNKSLFVSREEVEEAWKWIDPIINAWKKNKKSTLKLYTSGTWGPKNSDLIMSEDNHFWHTFSQT